jgi:hypothetical protein
MLQPRKHMQPKRPNQRRLRKRLDTRARLRLRIIAKLLSITARQRSITIRLQQKAEVSARHRYWPAFHAESGPFRIEAIIFLLIANPLRHMDDKAICARHLTL